MAAHPPASPTPPPQECVEQCEAQAPSEDCAVNLYVEASCCTCIYDCSESDDTAGGTCSVSTDTDYSGGDLESSGGWPAAMGQITPCICRAALQGAGGVVQGQCCSTWGGGRAHAGCVLLPIAQMGLHLWFPPPVPALAARHANSTTCAKPGRTRQAQTAIWLTPQAAVRSRWERSAFRQHSCEALCGHSPLIPQRLAQCRSWMAGRARLGLELPAGPSSECSKALRPPTTVAQPGRSSSATSHVEVARTLDHGREVDWRKATQTACSSGSGAAAGCSCGRWQRCPWRQRAET